MKKDIKRRWINALLSGEYPQTQGHLKDKVGYCCLGVLCDLYLKEKGGQWESEKYTFHIGTDYALLPAKVVEWSGVDSKSPYADNASLIGENDDGKTFEQIAELIKKHL